MNKMSKYALLLAFAILTTANVTAQIIKRQNHELSVYLGGGFSTLQYDLDLGTHKNGMGLQAGGSYAYFFLPNLGLRTGLEIAQYRANATLKDFADQYDVLGTSANGNYTYSYFLGKYYETQQALYLNIPLMLQFQTNRKLKFYAALGGKVGFPLKAIAKTTKYEVSANGYFPAEGRTYDDLPQYGFGAYEYLKRKIGLDNYKQYYMLSAELGLKWKILEKNDLYTGFYVDYGLGNIQNTNDKTFVTGSLSAEKPKVSPLVESEIGGTPFTDKIIPMAVGLKLRFSFNR